MNNRMLVITVIFLVIPILMIAYTKEIYGNERIIVTISQNKEDVAVRGDVIIIKFRTYNGHKQYRHWNVTQNCWVESDWIDL